MIYVVYWEWCWLYSLTAAGSEDLRYLSFTHRACVLDQFIKTLPVCS